MKKGDDPILVEQSLNTPIESVWKAITEVDQILRPNCDHNLSKI